MRRFHDYRRRLGAFTAWRDRAIHVGGGSANTRQEPGCLDYAYARDLLEPNTLRIAERWQDEAALHAHFQTGHTAVFNKILAGSAMEAASLHVYDSAHKRALIER